MFVLNRTSILGSNIEITNDLNGSHFENSVGNRLRDSPIHLLLSLLNIDIKNVYVPVNIHLLDHLQLQLHI